MASIATSDLGIASTSFGVDSGVESDVPPNLGRAQEIAEIVALLRAGNDVIVEGVDGLGRTALAQSVAYALTALNWRITDAEGWSPKETGSVLVIVDMEQADPTHAAVLDAASATSGVRFLLTRQPPRPFAKASPFEGSSRLHRAHTVRLLPLTLKHIDALIDEQLTRIRLRAEPGRLERLWVYANCGGYPELAISVLRDSDDATEEPGTLGRFSNATLVAASKIIEGLPESLQDLAGALVPLVGVRMSRVAQVFDRVELALLVQSHLVADAHDVLSIPAPIQAALRVRTPVEDRRMSTREVIADICAAHAVGAPCSEAEIFAASGALGFDKDVRSLVPMESQRFVLTTAMILARNRGDHEQAASLARRVMTVFPGVLPVVVKTIARSAPDPFDALYNRVANGEFADPPTSWWVWTTCLQLPFFHAVDGVIDMVEVITDHAEPEDHGRFQGLRTVLTAASVLESGETAAAREIAHGVATTAGVGVAARIRALVVVAAACAVDLDHAGLRAVEEELVEMARSVRRGDALDTDLDARAVVEGFLGVTVSFAAAGLRPGAQVRRAIEDAVIDTLVRGETTSLGPLALAYGLTFDRAQHGDEVRGASRVMRKTTSTSLIDWLTSLTAGGYVAPHPDYVTGSRFVRYAVPAMNLAFSPLTHAPEQFAVAVDEVPGANVYPRLARAFVQALRQEPIDAIDVNADDLEAGSLPWALTMVQQGLQRQDPARVLAGAEGLLSLGGTELAHRALEIAAEFDAAAAHEQRLQELWTQAQTSRGGEMAEVVLTRRERQVSILAAQGVSNREIARQLFLSVRTVESHMYRAMRKLAVTREGLNLAKLLRMPEES